MKSPPRPQDHELNLSSSGCGTGAITALLATTYPNAHVIGVDLAPVPESRHGKHPNLEYVQANVVDLIGQDPRFEPESFDYIFERLLVMGVSDWPGHVSSVSRLLKPGGYLELHEIDMDLLAPDEKPLKMEWYDAFLQDTRASSLDMQIGRKLPALLRSAPFENVQDFQYPFPPKPVEGQPQFDGMAGQLSAMFPLMITKVCGAQRGAEKAQEVVADFRRTYDPGFEPGTHWIMWVIVGQKK